MNPTLTNLINRSNDALVKLSYAVAIGSSFEEMDDIIRGYHVVCSELEVLDIGDIDALILEAKSVDFNRSETALAILSRNPFPHIVEALVNSVNSEDITVSSRSGLALRSLVVAPENIDTLFEGANKTNSFGQIDLKIACLKWSEGKNIDRIVKLVTEETDADDICILLEALIIQRNEAYTTIYESFVNHKNEEVQATAIAGLILHGRTELSSRLIELAKSKKSNTKNTVYTWMSHIMLPEFVPIILQGQTEKSADFRYYNLVRIGSVGTNQSIEVLLEAMKSKDQAYLEQAGYGLNQITDKQIFPNDFKTMQKECLSITDERNSNQRYFGSHLLTPEILINELHKNGYLFWQLLSMTGEHFGFDPNLHTINNWEAINKGRSWITENNHFFEPGAFYFLGEKK
jgi:HEAT repeat protein